jgi:hypothetical protein
MSDVIFGGPTKLLHRAYIGLFGNDKFVRVDMVRLFQSNKALYDGLLETIISVRYGRLHPLC